MAGEDQIERLAHWRELRICDRVLGDRRGMTGGEQQLVALPYGDFELLGEQQHHLGTGRRAARLDEAQMPRRYPRVERHFELGAPPPFAPLTQQRPDPWLGADGCHPVVDSSLDAFVRRLPLR